MSEKYKVRDSQLPNFITSTIIDWIDLFTRKCHKDLIIDVLCYCQQKKGLIVHAYVIMPSHLHLIVSAKEGEALPAIIRDFKKYTSRELIKSIEENPESRREWLLKKFGAEAKMIKRAKQYKVWKDGFHPVLLDTNEKIDQRLNYLHNNPVKDGIVNDATAYLYSSAMDYAGNSGMLPIERIDY